MNKTSVFFYRKPVEKIVRCFQLIIPTGNERGIFLNRFLNCLSVFHVLKTKL